MPAEGGAVAESVDPDVVTLQRAHRGDEPAWQELFDRWKKPLLSYFYRSLGSWPEAEDLVLEVFVRLHRSAGAYEPRTAFAAYLFTIARNLLLNEHRRRRRKPAELCPPGAFDHLEAPEGRAAGRLAELEEILQRALGQLPEPQRTVLLLVHQQHLDITDAAAVVGVTPNAFRVQLHRARERLKDIISTLP